MSVPAGTRFGEYEIRSLLGAGGMGEVYRARDPRLRRDVAIKILPASVATDAERLRRFEQEAMSAAALNHPNILAVFQLGTHDGTPYIVSELLEGETLRAQMQRGRIGVRKAIDYGAQIARGLAAAHEKGIVHRDLKPENLFVTKDGRVKILDFGLAKLTQPLTNPDNAGPTLPSATELGVVMGTVGYMSPEQVRGESVDHRSDLFSFGAVLYEMLAGARAFQKPTGAETMTAILNEDPSAISRAAPGVALALQRVVQRCLEKNPEQRFHSASDLSFALEALTDSGTASASAAAQKKPARKWSWLAIAVAAVALAVLGWKFLPQRQAVHSVAVLPFSASDQESSAADMSDGVTEALIDSLSQLPELRVMSRASSFRFRGDNVDPQQAGHALKVDAVITGRISHSADKVVISAELVNVEDGSHLWGNRYSRNTVELLALQQEIAGDLSQRLQPKLSIEQKQKVGKAPTDNPEAYQFYVKGRYFFDRWSPEGRVKALQYFQQAIAKDPNFAAAYAGLANTQIVIGFFGESENPGEMAEGMATVRKALSLDNSLAEAHSSLGLAYGLNLRWSEGEQESRKGVELNPNCSLCHLFYGTALMFLGRTDVALAEIRRAQELDPLSFNAHEIGGEGYYFARQFDEAIRMEREASEMDPTNPTPYTDMGDALMQKQMCPDAMKQFVRFEELTGHVQNAVALGKALESSGCRGALKKQLEFYSDRANPDYYPMSAAVNASLLGEKDMAFKFIEQAYQTRQGIIWLKVEPGLDNIRSDPRYAALLQKTGLADGPQPSSR